MGTFIVLNVYTKKPSAARLRKNYDFICFADTSLPEILLNLGALDILFLFSSTQSTNVFFLNFGKMLVPFPVVAFIQLNAVLSPFHR